MMAVRQSRWFVSAIVIVTAVAWMFASNHCAIAATALAAKASEHSCCHKDGAEHKAPHNSSQCCEAFNVPVPDQVSAPVLKLCELPPVGIPSLAIADVPAPDLSIPGFLSAAGPPGLESFSELVLQKSLPAHAPPVVLV